jgi:hypothetical protein
MKTYVPLEDWAHESGRLLVIGDAAHPIPVSYIRESLDRLASLPFV